ncbi:MAG: hypothetical protein II430_00600, partial [Selenomonas sp.]|nr:hypothetical protein [Selenomonas sp.]
MENKETTDKKIILSGIQPTGVFTLGNYLGAVKNWQKYTFKREWLSVIVLLLVLQLSTSAVSIFSGFFYLD